MIKQGLSNYRFYNLLSDLDKAKYFTFKKSKILPNVDTLYYSISIKTEYEWKTGNHLIPYLASKKRDIKCDPIALTEIDESLIMNGFGFNMYKYDVELPGKWILFIADYLPNAGTPQIIVQLRSEYLWKFGESVAVKESFKVVEYILNSFQVKGEIRAKLNRMDMAYHTNIITNPTKHFKHEDLGRMQVSRFQRWHLEGTFDGEDVITDYFTLGRRKSNNVFLRVYDKVQEVVNQGYKQFFIQMWYDNELINLYDFEILNECFRLGNYKRQYFCRLEWLLKNYADKLDPIDREEIELALKKDNSEKIKKLANEWTPPITLIMNIEFQIKRKFFSTLDDELKKLKTRGYDDVPLLKIFLLIDNKHLIHDLMVNDVIRFVDMEHDRSRKRDKRTAPWWELIQNVDVLKRHESDTKLLRRYQKNKSIEAMRRRIDSNLITLAIYQGNEHTTIVEDVINYLEFVNESDIQRLKDKKTKKMPTIKNRL